MVEVDKKDKQRGSNDDEADIDDPPDELMEDKNGD